MAGRVYHWKHGWIPLDHYAALKKAHGSEAGAKKYGFAQVSHESLPREPHISATYSTETRAFTLKDLQSGHTVDITEEKARKVHTSGRVIRRVNSSKQVVTRPNAEQKAAQVQKHKDEIAAKNKVFADWQKQRELERNRVFDPADPLAYYGNNVTVHNPKSADTQKNLEELKQFSPGVHKVLAKHFSGKGSHSGFFVGDTGIPELDDLGHLRGKQPRGWPPGETFDKVGGVYNPSTAVVAIGSKRLSGSVSTSLHEGSHALDDALGYPSKSAEFKSAWDPVAEALPGMNPYFRRDGNPTGHLSEAFAEAHAAFSKNRDRSKDNQITLMAKALHYNANAFSPKTRTAVEGLLNYFSRLDARLESR